MTATDAGVAARRLAIDALVRIDRDDAFANLALGPLLERSGLSSRDRGLVTELVYGTVRMRRACDWLVERFLTREPDEHARAALRVGAYQLVFMGMPPHAAVSSTVGAAPKRSRGFVNAVLRRVADAGVPRTWPGEAVRLSYPDWIVAWADDELGPDEAREFLSHQNRAPEVTERADGYVQDLASQWVASVVGAEPGDRVLDLCAGPGGKATSLASEGVRVVAGERSAARAGLVSANAARLGIGPERLSVVVADGRVAPFAPGGFDRVLVDAPCSGLGVLRRRPDARWRIGADDVRRLAGLQRELLESAAGLVRPGGRLVYSVCTLTSAETVEIDGWLAEAHPELLAVDPPGNPWQAHGRGAWVLPQWSDTDGMFVLALTRGAA